MVNKGADEKGKALTIKSVLDYKAIAIEILVIQ